MSTYILVIPTLFLVIPTLFLVIPYESSLLSKLNNDLQVCDFLLVHFYHWKNKLIVDEIARTVVFTRSIR
jgi:hypothetical protein